MELNKTQKDVNEVADIAYKSYQLERFEEAFAFLEELISTCLKSKKYSLLFITIFNRNMLLKILKDPLQSRNEKFLTLKEYDLKERFNSLPSKIQQEIEPLYNFLNFSHIYKIVYNVAESLERKENSLRYIKRGGMVLNSHPEIDRLKHKNMIQFVLKNRIMIDNYSEFKLINRLYIRILLTRQSLQETAKLNKYEIYSCIKYLNYEFLNELFSDLKGKEPKQRLEINAEDKKWLINVVLNNLSERTIKAPFQRSTKYKPYFENALFLLSLVELDDSEIEEILALNITTIKNGANNSTVFESINRFLGIQYTLFKTKIPEVKILEILEIIVDKFVRRSLTPQEVFTISSDSLNNLYSYIKLMKASFKNKRLIEELILYVRSNFDTLQQIDIAASLMINIFHIATKEIKTLIKTFLLEIDITKQPDDYRILPFQLLLVINNFRKLSNTELKKVYSYLEKYKDRGFSTDLYTLHGQIDYLVHTRKIDKLEQALIQLNKLIDRHKNRDLISLF